MGLSSAVAIAGLALAPFGAISDLVPKEGPWRGFDHRDPVLLVARAQAIPAQSCASWSEAIVSVPGGEWIPVPGQSVEASALALKSVLGPKKKEDLEAIEDCDSFPCKVKLDEREVKSMAQSPKEKRVELFYSLMAQRAQHYRQSGARKEYEFKGDPIDPWKDLESRGLKFSVPRPEMTTLFARRLDIAPGKMQALSQVLDRRARRSDDGRSAVVWVRDAYTDHYFDGWGEWTAVDCQASRGIVVQLLWAEMDFLKKTDFLSKANRARYRSAFEENGQKLLDREFERLKRTALDVEKSEKPKPKT